MLWNGKEEIPIYVGDFWAIFENWPMFADSCVENPPLYVAHPHILYDLLTSFIPLIIDFILCNVKYLILAY